MKYAIITLVALLVLVLVVVAIGYSLPVSHRSTRSATYPVPADSIFHVITNYAAFPEWRSRVKSVQNDPCPDCPPTFIEKGADGAIRYVMDEMVPAKRVITRIADNKLPFGGKWTYDLMPTANGTTLRITEDGEVYNPLFRFMSKFVFGHTATIDTYLNDLARKLGQPVQITG